MGALTSFEQLEARSPARKTTLLVKVRFGQASAATAGVLRTRERAQATLTLAREQVMPRGRCGRCAFWRRPISNKYGGCLTAWACQTPACTTCNRRVVAAAMEGYRSPEFLDQLAAAHADDGDFRAALGMPSWHRARNQTRNLVAQKRAGAADTPRGGAGADRDSASPAAAVPPCADGATLETLGTIGREVTASREIEPVFAALYRHRHEL
ncbi:MAG: hypothetical protein IPF55_11755 [Rhodoferax sp.]|nr:hypothetical protein [Rhodoferax sp.]